MLAIWTPASATQKPVFFYSLVNVHYSSRPLLGWQTTRDVIAQTLQTWYPEIQAEPPILDASAEQTYSFLKKTASAKSFPVIYIGSKQSSRGLWEEAGGGYWNPVPALRKTFLSKPKDRILILDTCHTLALGLGAEDWPRLAAHTLLAAEADEVTYQLNFNTHRPVDIQERYPRVHQWIKEHLDEETTYISYLGIIWLKTWLETPASPQSKEDWQNFFQHCIQNSEEFKEHHSRLSSTMKSVN